jgi:ketosteroid isomerase-like protein
MKWFEVPVLVLTAASFGACRPSSQSLVNDRDPQTPASTSAAPSASVEAQIRALDETQAKAWVARDQAALEQLWSPEFVIHAPSNQILTREETFREMMTPRLEMLSLERTVERVTQFGDIAISMGVDRYVPKNGPEAGQVHTQPYTNVWRREGNTWRKIARHANVLPLGVTRGK